MKVVTVVGTRPEIIRLSEIIKELDRCFEHILIHTGQNYDFELNDIFFNDLDLRLPDIFLDAAKGTPAETIGNILNKIDVVLENESPDAFLVLGDTNSCLSAISAKRRKIPIFHMEAGNRCFDMRVPEEINRKIVDHVADVNLTYSSIARQYLLDEGFKADLIIKTGSPMKEVINANIKKIQSSKILKTLNLNKRDYFLVSLHREENLDDEIKFNEFIETLNLLVAKFKKKVIVSTHPRTRKKLETIKIDFSDQIYFHEPLSFSDYNNLQINSLVVLSDSGTISEESSILNFNAINIRDSHERPEAMEEATVMMSGLDSNNILNGIDILLSKNYTSENIVGDYDVDNLSKKIVKIIISYSHYVQKKVWKKY